MRRKTFDTLVTSAGLLLAVVLHVAGGLLTWGPSFGETLRGLLLNAYAFGTMGTIAGLAAIAAFIAAAVMLLVCGLGFWHQSRTSPDTKLLLPGEPGLVLAAGAH